MTEQEWTDFKAEIAGHTEGPWFIEEQNSAGTAYRIRCTIGQSGDSPEQISANAALIAAAPTLVAEVERLRAENARLNAALNTPELDNFAAGVVSEAQHQRQRWGSQHDAGKTAFDWFWLLGYLGQKAAEAHARGDLDKAKHHTISTAAALANWHAALSSQHTDMRPGIGPGNAVFDALTGSSQ